MRVGEHDENYLWLRQSVTFTANGQTRTLEIAIPVRRGSTPDEIETMLDEADAGMARLSRRLDAHLTEQVPSPTPARQTTIAEAPTETPAPVQAPTPAPKTTPTAASAPTQPAATQPAAPAPASAPTPASRSERPAAFAPPPSRPAPPPAPARSAASAPATASTPPGPPMTIPQFIAAIAELGLNPKQAMDRLNVRTLSGLNLREALETLRRQMLHDEPPAPTEAPSPPAARAAAPPSAPARPAPAPATPAAAQFFEEEDDFTFGLEDDEALEDGDTLTPTPGGAESYGANGYGSAAEDEPGLPGDDDFDLLADLPDFDALAPMPAAPEPAPSMRPSSRPSATRPASGAASQPAPMPAGPSGPLSGPEHARALRRIGQLRGAQGGGAATPYQRNAYKNLVVEQLGETTATSLVRGLWRTTPAQLTGDQLDALKGWAKEDAFTEDVPLVLEALRAERARAARESGAAGEATGDAPEANRPPQPRRASGSRGEPAGGR